MDCNMVVRHYFLSIRFVYMPPCLDAVKSTTTSAAHTHSNSKWKRATTTTATRDTYNGWHCNTHVHVHHSLSSFCRLAAFTLFILHWPDFCCTHRFQSNGLRAQRTIFFFWLVFIFSLFMIKILSRLSNILQFIWMRFERILLFSLRLISTILYLIYPFLFVFSIWLQLRAQFKHHI